MTFIYKRMGPYMHYLASIRAMSLKSQNTSKIHYYQGAQSLQVYQQGSSLYISYTLGSHGASKPNEILSDTYVPCPGVITYTLCKMDVILVITIHNISFLYHSKLIKPLTKSFSLSLLSRQHAQFLCMVMHLCLATFISNLLHHHQL